MDQKTFDEIVRLAAERQREIMSTKGADYAQGNVDRLANFKRAAEWCGVTPRQALGIYMIKHIEAVYTYIREGDVHSEPVQGRIDDIANYLLLLEALFQEERAGGDLHL